MPSSTTSAIPIVGAKKTIVKCFPVNEDAGSSGTHSYMGIVTKPSSVTGTI